MEKRPTWSRVVQRLSAKLFAEADEDDLAVLAAEAPESLEKRSLGFPGATEEAIAMKEATLGVRLPDDYRAFLLASNGFRTLRGLPFGLCSLLPVEQIGWFKDKDKETGRLASYLERHASGEKMQDPFDVAPEDFERTLLIGDSDGNECILLLPPRDESEWKLWTCHPETGFEVDDSFTDFMESALEV